MSETIETLKELLGVQPNTPYEQQLQGRIDGIEEILTTVVEIGTRNIEIEKNRQELGLRKDPYIRSRTETTIEYARTLQNQRQEITRTLITEYAKRNYE